MSKYTVRSYLEKLEALTNDPKASVSITSLIKTENPELEAKYHTGNPSYKGDRYELFKSLIPYFLQELQRKEASKYLLWQEYRQQHADSYGYSQFCFHLQQQQIASHPSMVLDHKPAEK